MMSVTFLVRKIRLLLASLIKFLIQPQLAVLLVWGLRSKVVHVSKLKSIKILFKQILSMAMNDAYKYLLAIKKDYGDRETLKAFWERNLKFLYQKEANSINALSSEIDEALKRVSSQPFICEGVENLEEAQKKSKHIIFVGWHHSTELELFMLAQMLPRLVALGVAPLRIGNLERIDATAAQGTMGFVAFVKSYQAAKYAFFSLDGGEGVRDITPLIWGMPNPCPRGYGPLVKSNPCTVLPVVSYFSEEGRMVLVIGEELYKGKDMKKMTLAELYQEPFDYFTREMKIRDQVSFDWRLINRSYS